MAIRVLIVDDSAFMRQIFFRLLSNDPELTVVATARDGVDALSKIGQYHPDVVTLDVAMPNMDGLECLAQIMHDHPVPVIMVSSLTSEGAEPTIRSLELGAVDYVAKPSTIGTEEIESIQQELIQKVKATAGVAITKLERTGSSWEHKKLSSVAPQLFSPPLTAAMLDLELLTIGSSTGGPKALYHLLPQLPADFPVGVVVAQHMPKDFTGIFAKRLNVLCQVEVVEGQDGDRIEPGKVLIAPSGRQTRVVRQNDLLVLQVSDQPGMLYKPSVDYLLESIAESCRGQVISIILTGMGSDGAVGMKKLRDLGARTIAEAEESCVVFGMPRVAIELGGAEYVESIFDIYARVCLILEESRKDKNMKRYYQDEWEKRRNSYCDQE
jgi:two-component system chemotaxis response regulator CheB